MVSDDEIFDIRVDEATQTAPDTLITWIRTMLLLRRRKVIRQHHMYTELPEKE